MRDLGIDEVRPFIERGYKLIVSTDYITSKYYGLLIIKENEYSIKRMYEVKIDEFMNFFESIGSILNTYNFCCVEYDVEKSKIVNSVKKIVFQGPCNGEKTTEVVNDFTIEEDDIFSSFIKLDKKIKTVMNKDVEKVLDKKKEN